MKMTRIEKAKMLNLLADISAQAMLLEMGAVFSKDKILQKLDAWEKLLTAAEIENA